MRSGHKRRRAQRCRRLDGWSWRTARCTRPPRSRFHAAKPGLWIRPGKDHAGEVETVDIGIPRGAPARRPRRADRRLRARAAAAPDRRLDEVRLRATCSSPGGSVGLTGAPAMACRAAMRAGAGYVTAFVPAAVQPVLAGSGVPEVMFQALPETEGGLDLAGVEQRARSRAQGRRARARPRARAPGKRGRLRAAARARGEGAAGARRRRAERARAPARGAAQPRRTDRPDPARRRARATARSAQRRRRRRTAALRARSRRALRAPSSC